MRQKELRLALVCYGGISLAVYMHGVSKEILKLARASADYQAGTEAGGRGANNDYTDTEAVYLDLLRQIGERLDLRVVVDVIAGASAGGINGVLLARALALDLAFDPLRNMWLDKADVTELLASERKASVWSKWILRPVVQWGLSQRKMTHLAPDTEMREKLSLFIRSRWFRPPFGGPALCDTLYDAIATMGSGKHGAGSLTPAGQWLDLFVTLTDFFGYSQSIPLHDPELITEREHRHTLQFRHRHFSGANMTSDFDTDDLPGLVFAARATASFPGAFPPARIAEIDNMVARRGTGWAGRDKFMGSNFTAYQAAGQDPMATAFIDGSVLNNKPFAQAIESIKQRPAYRQVDRRLVYIDPDPEKAEAGGPQRAPSMLRTLKGALSDIPRNQPIRDELYWINGFNVRVRRLKTVLDSAMPRIDKMVAEVIGGEAGTASDTVADMVPDMANLGEWRAAAGRLSASRSGYAYDGYLHLRIDAVVEQLATILAQASAPRPDRTAIDAWAERLRTWAEENGVAPREGAENAAAQAAFLNGLDADYRARRLRFVVRGLNQQYATYPTAEAAAPLDDIKGQIYGLLEDLRRCRDVAILTPRCRHMAVAIAGGRETNIGGLIGLLADDFSLNVMGRRVDGVLHNMAAADLPGGAQRALLNSFLGFAFWDVLAFTVTSWRDIGEFDEIRVDRISPDDANSLHHGGAEDILKGVGLGHFAAFFSRKHRENDYLWGRLHGAERLIDIVISSAALEGAAGGIDVPAMKRRAFTAILEAEALHLGKSQRLLDELREEIAAL
ncbi:MAG: patatin-like protein [Alphaproteobacteria bacterium]